uniref:Uncharacterized protein n=1 Tax=Arion vulgaris TaxID=1028688 RepID=A0A0B6ZDI7_9EUPU
MLLFSLDGVRKPINLRWSDRISSDLEKLRRGFGENEYIIVNIFQNFYTVFKVFSC